jgi:hypothetical protein
MTLDQFPTNFLTTDVKVACENLKSYTTEIKDGVVTYYNENHSIIEHFDPNISIFHTSNVEIVVRERLFSFSSIDEQGNKIMFGCITTVDDGKGYFYKHYENTTATLMDINNYLKEKSSYHVTFSDDGSKLKIVYGIYTITFSRVGFNIRIFGQDAAGNLYKLKPSPTHLWIVSCRKMKHGKLLPHPERMGIGYFFTPNGSIMPGQVFFH